MTTPKPRRASARATAAPTPLEEPVTTKAFASVMRPSGLRPQRQTGEGNAQHRQLRVHAPVGEREVRQVQGAPAEDEAGREVERGGANARVARDDLRVRREHLDLVRLVGADIEVPVDVELDSVGPVQRLL